MYFEGSGFMFFKLHCIPALYDLLFVLVNSTDYNKIPKFINISVYQGPDKQILRHKIVIKSQLL